MNSQENDTIELGRKTSKKYYLIQEDDYSGLDRSYVYYNTVPEEYDEVIREYVLHINSFPDKFIKRRVISPGRIKPSEYIQVINRGEFGIFSYFYYTHTDENWREADLDRFKMMTDGLMEAHFRYWETWSERNRKMSNDDYYIEDLRGNYKRYIREAKVMGIII